MGDREQVVDIPKYENKWNPNTMLTFATLFIMLAGGVTAWNTLVNRASTAETDINELRLEMGVHSNRISENRTITTTAQADMNRLSDRVAANEKSIENADKRFDRLAESIDDLKSDLSSATTQIELSRQILLRMEAAQNSMMRNNVPGELAAPPERRN